MEQSRQVDDWVVTFGISDHGGRRAGFNTRGDVAFAVYFANGAQAVIVAQRPPGCVADLNGDGTVDAADLAMLFGGRGTIGPVGYGADVDWDGDVDGADLAVLLGRWGPCE